MPTKTLSRARARAFTRAFARAARAARALSRASARAFAFVVAANIIAAAASAAFGYTTVANFLDKPDEWYRSDEAKHKADVVMTWQAELGGWPKNTDTGTEPYKDDPKKLEGTFDNGATTF